MANLPAKSSSRRIQKQHTRKIMTREGIKPVLVNKGVKKKVSHSVLTPPAIISARTRSGGHPIKSIGSVRPTALLPRLRWQEVLKPQKGPTELELAAKEDKLLEDVRKTLQPGEVLARRVHLVFPDHPMSVSGELEFIDDQGIPRRVFMEYRMSGAGLIEYLQEMEALNKPVVLYIGEQGFMASALNGARPAEPLTLQDSIPMNPSDMWISVDGQTGKVTAQNWSNGKTKKFASKAAYEKAEEKAYEKGLDVFGDRISPQSTLKEFPDEDPLRSISAPIIQAIKEGRKKGMTDEQIRKMLKKRGPQRG